MTESSNAMKWLVGAGAIIAVGTPMFIGGQYVTSLSYDMQAANREVANLKGQVEQLQAILASTSGAQASAGLPGPVGPAGPPGPKGDTGPAGISAEIDESTLRGIIEDIVAKSLSPAAGATSTASVPVPASKAPCIKPGLAITPAFELKVGSQLCDNDGKIYATVRAFEGSGVQFEMSSGETRWCTIGSTCQTRANEIFEFRSLSNTTGEVVLKGSWWGV